MMSDKQKTKKRLKELEQQERAERMGVRIENSDDFERHLDNDFKWKFYTFLCLIGILIIAAGIVYDQSFTSTSDVRNDIKAYSYRCDDLKQGFFIKEYDGGTLKVDCAAKVMIWEFE